MPVFKVQAPDGTVIKIEAADQATAIRGAQEHYASKGGKPAKVNPIIDTVRGFTTGVKEAVAGVADSYLEAQPVIGALHRRASGRNPLLYNPLNTAVTAATTAFSYKPKTTAGEVARTVGQNTPNAIAPGSLPARAFNVFAPAIGSEIAGRSARALGADANGEAIARAGGGLAGAGIASVRAPNVFRPQDAVAIVGQRSRQNVPAMRGRAAQMRQNGVEPTLVDVVDDSGRGLIRAAANKQTPGRQAANDFAERRVLNLPDRMSTQARANMSRDARTPDEIRAAQVARRTANANRDFGAVRGDAVEMAPETVQALRNPIGREAIAEAAKRERDPEVRAALLRLSDDALDNPSTPITVGMADRISRTLFGRAQAASRNGDNDLAATLNGLAESVRGPTRNASPGYRQALEGYAADSRLTEAAGVGENLLTRNTDEFVQAASGLGARERPLAAAAGRRAIERAAGENPSSAISVARRIAVAPEQQARTAALLGPERAARLQAGMGAEARAVLNARQIAPGAGSSTFLNAADDGALVEAAGLAGDVLNRNVPSLIRRAHDAFRSRGMNDQQIERLIDIAIDPRQTDAAIDAIARSLDPAARQELFRIRNAALTGGLALTTGGFRATSEERQ